MQLLTTMLALYGAVLSSIVAALNWRRGSSALRVQAYPGYWTEDDPRRAPGFYAVVELANERQVPVQAKALGMMFPFRRVTIWEKIARTFRYRRHWRETCWLHSYEIGKAAPELPLVIEPAHGVEIWVPEATLLAAECDGPFRCVFYVQDGLGRRFSSNVFHLRSPTFGWKVTEV